MAENMANAAQAQTVFYPEMDTHMREAQKRRSRNRRIKRAVPKVIAWALVVAVVAFLVFFISSKVAHFDSIGDMFEFISRHFANPNLSR